jgi:hypothetical protein
MHHDLRICEDYKALPNFVLSNNCIGKLHAATKCNKKPHDSIQYASSSSIFKHRTTANTSPLVQQNPLPHSLTANMENHVHISHRATRIALLPYRCWSMVMYVMCCHCISPNSSPLGRRHSSVVLRGIWMGLGHCNLQRCVTRMFIRVDPGWFNVAEEGSTGLSNGREEQS